jgi:hypothetical protein
MAKAKKAPVEKPAPKTLRELGLQTATKIEVHRSELKGADYNPREIDDAAKRKLRAGLKKHGLVSDITWNKRTGLIVGGHQRLQALDALAGTSDYRLEVNEIDVDPKREKELNVLLNNPEAQGIWDLEKLGGLLTDGMDLAGAGFDQADIYRIFGESLQLPSDTAAIEDLAGELDKLSATFTRMETGNKDAGHEFYIVVVFESPTERTAFLADHKLPDNRYQSGKEIKRLIGALDPVRQKDRETADGENGQGVDRSKRRRKAAAPRL